LHANHTELLAVLDHPHIPLHTNGSENDIRCQVTKRKVSGGTRSDIGRDCRDAFLGLAKTCASWAWLLGLSRQQARQPRSTNRPEPGRHHPLPRTASVTLARAFAPVTRHRHNLMKCHRIPGLLPRVS
jgi:hypothetical protein